jgi:hypothetical protein
MIHSFECLQLWYKSYLSLFRPAFALVAFAVLHEEGVLVTLVSSLVSALGGCAPWTDGVHVTL